MPVISIHALLAESDALKTIKALFDTISIHALLAESDHSPPLQGCGYSIYFYPRSPCGERLRTPQPASRSLTFLSTLSLRRATGRLMHQLTRIGISIHALLAESDGNFITNELLTALFLSTLSLRRATKDTTARQQIADISIHALLAESD